MHPAFLRVHPLAAFAQTAPPSCFLAGPVSPLVQRALFTPQPPALGAPTPRPPVLWGGTPPPPQLLPLGGGPSLAAAVPGLPRVTPAEILRLAEDKAFDIAPAARHLGFAPRPLALGLAGAPAPRTEHPEA